ncbi:MAG TPA: PEGA domain-containing protein, partial [Methanoregulaceae archaeon]|nr:PEGA domain-containing protein [Methanoregulaceae archaeon]
ISKIGYITWLQSYSLNPEPGQTIPVFAPLQTSELAGSVSVSSVPNGALVSLDGQNGQMAPWIYGNVPVGMHMVQAYLSGYSPYTTQVNVESGQTSFVEAGLIPLGSVGTLQVISSPGGADLYVDDVYKGKTSLTVGNLASGDHSVVLKLYGYQEITGKTTVDQGQTTILSFTLTPGSQPRTGTLTVSSSPPGAGIYVDDEYRGLTRSDGPVVFTGMVPGEHGVTLKLANYQVYTKTFEIAAGQTVAVTAVLTAGPVPIPFAALEISSYPSGASAFVDDVFSGQTPVTIQSVPSGHHTIAIRMNGYEDYNTGFNLSPGQSALISAALAPLPAPVPTKSPIPAPGAILIFFFLAGLTVRLTGWIKSGTG